MGTIFSCCKCRYSQEIQEIELRSLVTLWQEPVTMLIFKDENF